MSNNKPKLELTWIGKENRPRLEPRILLEDGDKSYRSPELVSGPPTDHTSKRDVMLKQVQHDIFDNRLIFGDNLLALKALEQEFAGKIKCIFIDPPYNTGAAFTHYDDGVEHSIWLSLMRDRLELLQALLSNDGSIWMTIDDNEAHYLKVLCDEVFGRANFVSSVAWMKRVSPANDAKYFSSDHDFLLVYAKEKASWLPNRLPRNEQQNTYYKNPDNDPRGPWNSVTYTGNKTRAERPNLYYGIKNPNTGEIVYPPETLTWRYGPETHARNEAESLLYWGRNGRSKVPRLKMFLRDAEPIVPRSVWLSSEAGSTQTAMVEQKSQFSEPFSTPKPELLLQRVIHIASNPGDWVLDSFGGSGTSGAVAHKMGRRWIMVELGEHCHTHIIPRMKKVIDGEDPGGITKAVNWQGGGGFRYFRLAPSLLEKDKWGNWVISKEYNATMLAASMAKHEGFVYNPDEALYWKQGRSTEKDYIFTTTNFITIEYLDSIHEEMHPDESLLVCCKSFQDACLDRYENITVKKIPNMLLGRCEFGKEDYSLNIPSWEGPGVGSISSPEGMLDGGLDDANPVPGGNKGVKKNKKPEQPGLF